MVVFTFAGGEKELDGVTVGRVEVGGVRVEGNEGGGDGRVGGQGVQEAQLEEERGQRERKRGLGCC